MENAKELLMDIPVIRDRFEIDPAFETYFAFPCCVCVHRVKTDREEPCIRCENNLRATGA